MKGTDMKSNLNSPWRRRSLLVAAGGLPILALSLALSPRIGAVSTDEKPAKIVPTSTVSFAPGVKKVSPSVVRVDVTIKPKNAGFPGGPGSDNPMFRWFFGDEPGQGAPGRRFRAPAQHGLGSGVIVSKDGYLLTNNHVVDGVDQVKVSLQDGRSFTAKVVGTDPHTDVAVLKIDASDLPALEIADSDKLEVGDVVLAVGNPYGIGQTVTTGIVSATGRATLGLDYEDFIQTDAAINQGNSGGALVDSNGHLIGINTAIFSPTGGNVGIGFAIPANLARYVMDSLIKDGRVSRGYIGVMIQDVTPALAKKFDLKEQAGAIVAEVKPNGPADKAGLKDGDVVVEWNGKPVSDSRSLKLQVAQVQPGKTVPVKVLRDGKSKTLEVTTKELPGSDKLAKGKNSNAEDEGTLNGVTVSDLDAQARRQLDVPANLKGVVVTDVEQDSASFEAGLRPGDVILEINRQAVKSAEEAVKMTEDAKDKTTLLRVWRKGDSRFVVVDESK
jgi:serine protease Do